MFKFLKDVVVGSAGGIKDLPYNIGDPYSSAWGSWTHHHGTSKDENSQVSIFTLTCANSHDGRLMAARNGAKRLRTVRHPNILSYLHSTEVEAMEGSVMKSTIYVVTEPVMPLSEKIKELNLEGTQRDEYYAWGLHQIAKAVSFLNNDCKLVHGNICLASVVVTPNLDWKLHAFDVLSEFDGANPQSAGPMLQFESLIALQYKPMELAKSDWMTIRKSPPWAIDSWGLGCLIYELFSGTKLSKTEELRNIGSIPKTLLTDYQRLLGSVPTRRSNPSKLIENSEFFQNKLVETIHFMDVLNLKDSVEKDSFFRKLSNISEQLPREVVLKKLLPMLASSLEFGSASALAINSLLKIGSWLSTEEFNIKVLPTIVKLFASNDRGIRIGLLQHIEQFGSALSSQAVDEQVFPHVATGFSDTSAFLRELTLKSMLTLAPKLSQRTITGSLLKILSKLQVDEEVAIRTNTTILLGNIASFLGEGTRKRVLINAFTVRALRDAFPPARAAGIMALCATCTYYDPIEISTRILPSIVPLTIDGDSDVRSKAFQATEQFLNIVKEHHLKINSEDGVVNNSFVAADSAGGLLGWAMGSLTSKGKGSENNVVPSGSIVTSSSLPIIQNSGTGVDPSPQSTTAPIQLNNSAAAPISSSVADGWGELETNGGFDEDKDGWDDMDQVESSAAASLFAGIQSAQQKPLQPNKIHTANTRASVTASETYETNESTTTWGEEDPWAAIAAPAPVVKSRPSNMGLSGRSVAPQMRSGQHVSLDSVLGGSKTRSSSSSSSSGRGRGGRAAPMKLGAQRVNHPPT